MLNTSVPLVSLLMSREAARVRRALLFVFVAVGLVAAALTLDAFLADLALRRSGGWLGTGGLRGSEHWDAARRATRAFGIAQVALALTLGLMFWSVCTRPAFLRTWGWVGLVAVPVLVVGVAVVFVVVLEGEISAYRCADTGGRLSDLAGAAPCLRYEAGPVDTWLRWKVAAAALTPMLFGALFSGAVGLAWLVSVTTRFVRASRRAR